MSLEYYLSNQYLDDPKWFMHEVNQANHSGRIASTIANRDYLAGRHNVLNRENGYYKGKVFVVRKTILNYAKTIIRFHNTYLLGKAVQLSNRDSKTVEVLNDIYRLGMYGTVDYEIIDRVNKFGDAYEVVYVDNGVIKSKILDSSCSYPVYDDSGEYVAFIEHYTDAYTAITFWNVYYGSYVEHWTNEGGEEHLVSVDRCFGLPIHYHNFSDEDYNFGRSMLADVKPIMDDLEDIMSKMGDSIYTNTLNPMPVALGQRIESSIPADMVGMVMNLDNGDFKYANCNIDYNTIKLYLDNMKQMLNDIACIPSVLGSSTNIANVSEMSMKILMMMANLNAEECKKWLNIGFAERFRQIQKILSMQGIDINSDIEVIYNIGMPVASAEMISNLKAMQEMGAISVESIMEKSDIITDIEIEKCRLKEEKGSQNEEKKVQNDDGSESAYTP